MIRHTFQLLEGISDRKERNILRQAKDWDEFLAKNKIEGIADDTKLYYNRQLLKAKKALHNFDSSYFIPLLPSTETWRLYDFFKEDAVFLDIETEGLGEHADITVIGLFDGINTKTMIKNINMDYKSLKKELSRYKLIITFNGSIFDLPFISKRYDILPNLPHIDLRHCCSRLGLKGGLKEIERYFGIKRNKIIENLYGGDPLTLWRMYKGSGDEYYLNLLVEYNEEDVINLKKIMEYCYDGLKKMSFDEITLKKELVIEHEHTSKS
jgi:uncharacterized protein YprB with RNaseH-like and TPR domain